MGDTTGESAPPRKSERTRRRILDAAAIEFRHAGYNARLVDIADRAGMQAGSLYYHFASREELVAEILRLGISTSFEQTRAAVDAVEPADPLLQLRAAIRAHTMAVLGQSDYASAQARIVGQVPSDIAAAHEADQRTYGEYWHGLLTAAANSGALRSDIDLFAARMLAFGAMNWTTEWFDATRRLTADEIADAAVTLVLKGIIV